MDKLRNQLDRKENSFDSFNNFVMRDIVRFRAKFTFDKARMNAWNKLKTSAIDGVTKLLQNNISNGHKNFQPLAKFGLCSICSQNLDECSLARARKIFAITRMLGFSLKFARFLEIP